MNARTEGARGGCIRPLASAHDGAHQIAVLLPRIKSFDEDRDVLPFTSRAWRNGCRLSDTRQRTGQSMASFLPAVRMDEGASDASLVAHSPDMSAMLGDHPEW